MLFSTGKASGGDYSEQSLVSKFLLAMVCNEYSAVNRDNGKCFRMFSERFLDLSPEQTDFSRVTVSIELQANRACPSVSVKVNTRFDALITFEDDWIWGVEAKYFDKLTKEQINTEYESIKELAKNLGYKNAGLLFIVPEELVGSIKEDSEFKAELDELKRLFGETDCLVRLSSWEMIFDVINTCGNEDVKKRIDAYIDRRNENTNYPTKLHKTPDVGTSKEWTEIFLGNAANTVSLTRKLSSIQGDFGQFGKASSEFQEVFSDPVSLGLAQTVKATSGLEEKSQKSGYANLSRNGKAYAQMHPHTNGIALVIRPGNFDEHSISQLRASFESVPLQTLKGYKGSNKAWLEGRMYSDGERLAFFLPNSMAQVPMDSQEWSAVRNIFRTLRG